MHIIVAKDCGYFVPVPTPTGVIHHVAMDCTGKEKILARLRSALEWRATRSGDNEHESVGRRTIECLGAEAPGIRQSGGRSRLQLHLDGTVRNARRPTLFPS